MQYAYRQLLAEHPEKFPDTKTKEELAKAVVELESIKSKAAKVTSEIFTVIMEEDE